MKENILFINSCVRADSRTLELSRHLLKNLKGDVTEVNLYKENILPLNGEGLQKRELHDYSGEEFKFAKEFRDADIIIVAAPFWDLSFPSVLKVYFENITVSGLTFEYADKGRTVGKCNAKKLCYVTTSGGYIGENNFGFEYVSALAKNFFGIEDVSFYSAEGLDISGADVKAIMEKAKNEMGKGVKND